MIFLRQTNTPIRVDGYEPQHNFQDQTAICNHRKSHPQSLHHRFAVQPETSHCLLLLRESSAALAELRANDLISPQGAADCDILWRLDGPDLRGATDPKRCVSVSSTLNIPLSWTWDYLLQPVETRPARSSIDHDDRKPAPVPNGLLAALHYRFTARRNSPNSLLKRSGCWAKGKWPVPAYSENLAQDKASFNLA